MFIAGGKSPNFENVNHAVVAKFTDINKSLFENEGFAVVHDPNPNSRKIMKVEEVNTLHFFVDYKISERPNGI